MINLGRNRSIVGKVRTKLTVDGSVACDPHHTPCNIFLLSKFHPSIHQPLLILGSADSALDPTGCHIVDADTLFEAGAARCPHETAQPVLCSCVLPVSLRKTKPPVSNRRSMLAQSNKVNTHRRVNPGDHTSGDNETPVPLLRIRLLAEVVNGEFPCVQCSVQVDPDNIQVRLRGLPIRVLRSMLLQISFTA